MAKYGIKRLNYIASGENRTFVNMDVQPDSLYVYDNVHLLAAEGPPNKEDPLSMDIILEQRSGGFLPTHYIQAESTEETLYDPNHPEAERPPEGDRYDFSASISTFLSALAHDGFDSSKISVVLNEQQQYYTEISGGGQIYIRLYLSCCSEEYKDSLQRFIEANRCKEHNYLIEHSQAGKVLNYLSSVDSGNTVKPIYDIDDVCMKSCNAVRNNVLPSFDDSYPGMTEDIYLPSGVGKTGFCQVGNDTYVLTEPTVAETDRLRIVMPEDDGSTRYTTRLAGGELSTFLYTPLSSLSGCGSYQEAVASGLIDSDSFYDSYRNFRGVEYSYVADVPMKKVQNVNMRTEYANGNVYCDIMHGKNMYDSTYSMNMPSQDVLSCCREYTGIGKCSDKIYLKFDDVVSYSENGGKSRQDGVSYPKIEFFNKVASKNTSRHKSYFFSININDIELDAEDTAETAESDKMKACIKHDIRTAITDIVKNVCPVQTQLFDVRFDGRV